MKAENPESMNVMSTRQCHEEQEQPNTLKQKSLPKSDRLQGSDQLPSVTSELKLPSEVKFAKEPTERIKLKFNLSSLEESQPSPSKFKKESLSHKMQSNPNQASAIQSKDQNILPAIKADEDLPLSGIQSVDGHSHSDSDISNNQTIQNMMDSQASPKRPLDFVNGTESPNMDLSVRAENDRQGSFSRLRSGDAQRNEINLLALKSSTNKILYRSKSSLKEENSFQSGAPKASVHYDSVVFEDNLNYQEYHSKLRNQFSCNKGPQNIFKKIASRREDNPKKLVKGVTMENMSRRESQTSRILSGLEDNLNPKNPSTFKLLSKEANPDKINRMSRDKLGRPKQITIMQPNNEPSQQYFFSQDPGASKQSKELDLRRSESPNQLFLFSNKEKSFMPSGDEFSILNNSQVNHQLTKKESIQGIPDRKQSIIHHSITNGMPTATFLSKHNHTVWTFGKSRSRQDSSKNQKSANNNSVHQTIDMNAISKKIENDFENAGLGTILKKHGKRATKLDTYTPKYERYRNTTGFAAFTELVTEKIQENMKSESKLKRADSLSFEEEKEPDGTSSSSDRSRGSHLGMRAANVTSPPVPQTEKLQLPYNLEYI